MTVSKNMQIELPQELYNEFRAIVEAECSPKNKVAKLSDSSPHSCDSFIRAIRDPFCRFYHEFHEWTNDTNLTGYFLASPEGKTIKTAIVEAINEWRIRHVAFDTTDPLFDFSNVIESGGNAATVDEITYSGEAATRNSSSILLHL